jgi:crotonobetainyl-CoA:carnitine CoA-transferase CaiB-like acyl-CoA transferase
MPENYTSPLADVQVIEIAGERCPIAVAYAGRLLAEMGASVVKIEPPSGDPTRDIAPFLDDEQGTERSLTYWYYNTGKLGITLDLERREAADLLDRLLAGADVLVHGLNGRLEKTVVGETVESSNPRLVVTAVSPFGSDGPWQDFLSSDPIHLALSGIMTTTGYHDLPGSPPVAGDGGQAWHISGQWAVIGTLAALTASERDGVGQRVETTVHEACSVTTEVSLPIYDYTGEVVRRQTGREARSTIRPRQIIRCGDGRYVNFVAAGIGPNHWTELVSWLKRQGLQQDLEDDCYYIPEVLDERMEHVCEVLVEAFGRNTADDVYRRLQTIGLPAWVLRGPDEISEDPHLHARRFFSQVDHPELGRSFTYPGSAWKIDGQPPPALRRAPLLGEHNAAVYGRLGFSTQEIARLADSQVV